MSLDDKSEDDKVNGLFAGIELKPSDGVTPRPKNEFKIGQPVVKPIVDPHALDTQIFVKSSRTPKAPSLKQQAAAAASAKPQLGMIQKHKTFLESNSSAAKLGSQVSEGTPSATSPGLAAPPFNSSHKRNKTMVITES